MYFKYAVKQIFKRPFVNFVVIFQYVLLIILVTMITAKFESYFVVSNTIENICKQDCYRIQWETNYLIACQNKLYEISEKYSPRQEDIQDKYNRNEISEDEYYMLLQQLSHEKAEEIEKAGIDKVCFTNPDIDLLPYVEKKYSFYHSNLVAPKYDEYVDFISEDLSEDLNVKMHSGKWFSQVSNDSEYINLIAVSNNDYKVGDIIDLKVDRYDEEINYQGKIIGLIDYSEYAATWENASFETDEYVSFDDILPLKSYSIIAVNSNNDPYTERVSNLKIDEFCMMVKLKQGLSEKQKNEFFSTLGSNKYEAINMEKAYINTLTRDRKDFNNDIIFLTIAFMIAIISLIGISALNVSKEIQTYSVYCLLGMSSKQCVFINAICTLLMLGTAFIVSIAGSFVSAYVRYLSFVELIGTKQDISFSHYWHFEAKQFVTVIILMIISYLASIIIPLYSLKRINIIENLKSEI